MNILGINAFHGDASAALVRDGCLVAAVAEERLNRRKHCAGFPRLAIEACLKEGGLTYQDLDHVGVSRKPWAHLHRKAWQALRRSLQANTWKSAASTLSIGKIGSLLQEAFPTSGRVGPKIHHLEHHLTHAASAFLVSPFDRAAILTLDGFGDFTSGLLGMGTGGRIRVLDRIHFPHSLGVYYTALTQYLGFPHYGDEGKVMALASFGQPKYLEAMRKVVWFQPNGLIRLGLDYFTHHTRGVSMTWGEGSPALGTLYSDQLKKLLGPARKKGEPLRERDYDVAASLQLHLEEIVLQLVRHLADLTGENRICLAGGVALNSVINGRIRLETPFPEIFIQPAAGDDGTALGAAFQIENQILGRPRKFVMEHAYWGPTHPDAEIEEAIRRAGLNAKKVERPEFTAVEAITNGKVVGWYQGRSEFGPRALGNRSILADPRRPDMKQILNERVKHRETFRPFAPSLLEEDTAFFFEQDVASPFMLLVYKARESKQKDIQGALHVDQTGRLQTVNSKQNPLYYRLLWELRHQCGQGMVINTSFNDSEPIVETPGDAIHCFLTTQMDVLILGQHVIVRQ